MFSQKRLCALGLLLWSAQFCGSTIAKASACTDAVAAANNFIVQSRAQLSAIPEGTDDYSCKIDTLGLNTFLSVLPMKERVESVCSNLKTPCGSSCIREKIANARVKVARSCAASGSRKISGPPNCSTPPTPTAARRSSSEMCFKATNTNTDSRCVFSFTYQLTGKGSQAGGNVAPGETTERCSFQSGVDIGFEKWTGSGGNAH